MSRRSWTKTVAAVLLAALCVLMLPVKADAAQLAAGSVPAAKLWAVALDWLNRIVHGGGGDPAEGSGPPKFGAGQSSDGRGKSGRLPQQAQ
jgi:hypothetical protein